MGAPLDFTLLNELGEEIDFSDLAWIDAGIQQPRPTNPPASPAATTGGTVAADFAIPYNHPRGPAYHHDRPHYAQRGRRFEPTTDGTNPVYGTNAAAPAFFHAGRRQHRTQEQGEQETAQQLAPVAGVSNVPQWTLNQTHAYHVQVGRVQMSMPEHARYDTLPTPPNTFDPQSVDDKTSEPIELYPCRFPGCTSKHKPFKIPSARDKHEKKHKPKDELPHGCGPCGYYCRYPREVRRHNRRYHPNGDELDERCHLCGHTFGGRHDNLSRHLKTRHPDEWGMSGLATPPPSASTTTLTFDESEFPSLPPTPSARSRQT